MEAYPSQVFLTDFVFPWPSPMVTEEDLPRYCEKLPRYKRPRKVFFGEVPRNPAGKIEKPKPRKR